MASPRRQADVIMGLENEVHQMSHALEHASTNHEAVEKLGRVSGELEIVKRRLREVSEEKVRPCPPICTMQQEGFKPLCCVSLCVSVCLCVCVL